VEYALALLILVLLVALVVTGPLRPGAADPERVEDERRATLDAAREQKYGEIRDAELDYRTGKLSEADWKRTDGELREQAIVILRQLDDLGDEAAAEPRRASDV